MLYCVLTHVKGRGSGKNTSIIALRGMGSSAPKHTRFQKTGSAKSAVGVHKDAIGADTNHVSGKTARERRTKGNAKHLVGIEGALWHCDLCDKDISNIRESISQHKKTEFHMKRVRKAPATRVAPPLWAYQAHICYADGR